MTSRATRDEAARQQGLLAAIGHRHAAAGDTGIAEQGERASLGLQIYRANAGALAERALGAAFPTVHALIGPDNFKQMAREHWRDAPPRRGDIGAWGDGLAAWLDAHAQLMQWPYLADCARLDWLRHVCERAADAELDAVSLARLEAREPADVKLLLRPGSAVLGSTWPVASIFDAHHSEPRNLDAAREALAQRRGEVVLVARHGWRCAVHRIDTSTLAWTECLLNGATLATALERAGPAFDLTRWLTRALQEEWLQGVVEVDGDTEG